MSQNEGTNNTTSGRTLRSSANRLPSASPPVGDDNLLPGEPPQLTAANQTLPDSQPGGGLGVVEPSRPLPTVQGTQADDEASPSLTPVVTEMDCDKDVPEAEPVPKVQPVDVRGVLRYPILDEYYA